MTSRALARRVESRDARLESGHAPMSSPAPPLGVALSAASAPVPGDAISAVLLAVNGMHGDMTNMRAEIAAFRNGLPNDYMPRRESEQLFHSMQQGMADINTRVVAQEEWRLSETKRAAEAQMALQAQIQAAVISALKDTDALRNSTQQAVSQTKQDGLSRMNAVLLAIFMMLLGAGCTFIVSLVVGLLIYAFTHQVP